MAKILCFGSSGKDIFFPTGEGKVAKTPEDLTAQKKITFELGAKYAVKKRYEALGGCAANVASGLAKLGIEAVCESSVGDDMDGIWIREELKKNGVNIDLIKVEKSTKSDMSAIVIDDSSGDRVIFTSRTSGGKIEISAEKARDADWFFIGDVHGQWKNHIENIIELAKKENKRIVFNPREAGIHEDAAEIIEAMGLSEVVFVNKDEAIEIVSHITDFKKEKLNDEKYLLEKLSSLEMKIMVLTDGERGAWASDGQKTFHAQALKISAVDATGAGDSFLSGFLAAFTKEKTLEECLKWGIVLSSNVVGHYGAIEGLLSEEELVQKIGDIKVEKLN